MYSFNKFLNFNAVAGFITICKSDSEINLKESLSLTNLLFTIINLISSSFEPTPKSDAKTTSESVEI
ncbi:hypothetical protein [uncultured Methanobrevibacter sp.]|uniref:hypothetical protein n=1 Tax=uncultured Methanobrevibacter sp. TaxID=253161 RepID=UPI0025CFBDD8|nr:hypothetical protein [uncultured Methanobrevibacter sp.]